MRRVTFRRIDNDQYKVVLCTLLYHICGELLLHFVSKPNLIAWSRLRCPQVRQNDLSTESTTLSSDSISLIVESISFENRTCISNRHFIISFVWLCITDDKICSGSLRIHFNRSGSYYKSLLAIFC